jgi:hypothetical protein
MARLGELLVAAGLVTADQVEQALRAQVVWGGRLGTNLVELGHLELDDLARTLGRQHRLPAALARHFDRADRALLERLPSAVAERHAVLPLFRAGAQKDRVAIVSSAPLGKEALAHLADALGVPPARLVPSIAAELRIAYNLERFYRIPRDLRFLRPRNKTVPAFLHFEVIPVPPDSEPDLLLATDTQELPVVRRAASPAAALLEPEDRLEDEIPDDDDPDAIGEAWEHERRRYVRTITDELSNEAEPQAVGRIALRRIAIPNAPGEAGPTLVEAVRAIRHSTGRDRVAELVLDALDRFVPACEAAMLLVKRGDVAISWKGFARGGHALPEMAVELGPPTPAGLVSRAIEGEATTRARASALDPIDQLLHRSLGSGGGDLAVVPIPIGGQVMCAIALAVGPGAGLEAPASLAGAAGAAFARLMRAASR